MISMTFTVNLPAADTAPDFLARLASAFEVLKGLATPAAAPAAPVIPAAPVERIAAAPVTSVPQVPRGPSPHVSYDTPHDPSEPAPPKRGPGRPRKEEASAKAAETAPAAPAEAAPAEAATPAAPAAAPASAKPADYLFAELRAIANRLTRAPNGVSICTNALAKFGAKRWDGVPVDNRDMLLADLTGEAKALNV